jgi:hypothetical protein
MKSQSSLVRAKGRVELHTIPTINLELALVVFPDDTELNDALGNGDNLESCLVLWVLFKKGAFFES